MSRSRIVAPLRRLVAALLGAAALGSDAAAAPQPQSDASRPVIERVEAIRNALRARDAESRADADAAATERHAQWFNWPNWNNFWNNWPNWGNWPNW